MKLCVGDFFFTKTNVLTKTFPSINCIFESQHTPINRNVLNTIWDKYRKTNIWFSEKIYVLNNLEYICDL